jgi:TolB-like protein
MQTLSPSRRSLTFAALFIAVSTGSFLSSCSLITPRNQNGQMSKPEVRDVGYSARSSGDMNLRKRVIVLPFTDATAGRSEKAAQVAREAFIHVLKRTDEFVIIANSDFPKDIATYLKNGQYDLEAMAKVAGSMGLAGVIEGKVLNLRAQRVGEAVGIVREIKARISATVQIRLVNTKNGSIALDETRTADVEESTTRVGERALTDKMLEEDPKLIDSVVTAAFASTIPKIVQSVEKLSWEGRVAMVKGERVYLNAGRISGLNVGDILKITEEGEDVYDPDTGALIGKVPGRLKGTVEVVSYFGKDGAISIVHSGSGFRENDHVELY